MACQACPALVKASMVTSILIFASPLVYMYVASLFKGSKGVPCRRSGDRFNGDPASLARDNIFAKAME